MESMSELLMLAQRQLAEWHALKVQCNDVAVATPAANASPGWPACAGDDRAADTGLVAIEEVAAAVTTEDHALDADGFSVRQLDGGTFVVRTPSVGDLQESHASPWSRPGAPPAEAWKGMSGKTRRSHSPSLSSPVRGLHGRRQAAGRRSG